MTGRLKSLDARIGEQIFQARQAAGLSIEALATQTKLPVHHLINLELGESRADAKTVAQLARVLGIEMRALFDQCCNMQQQSADQLVSAARRNPHLVALLQAATAENFERRVA